MTVEFDDGAIAGALFTLQRIDQGEKGVTRAEIIAAGNTLREAYDHSIVSLTVAQGKIAMASQESRAYRDEIERRRLADHSACIPRTTHEAALREQSMKAHLGEKVVQWLHKEWCLNEYNYRDDD